MQVHAPAKAYKGWGMEGATAKWYAILTKKSLEDFKKLAARVAERVGASGSVLEVAPGPGYFAIELAKLGNYQVRGLDISQTFVEIARQNAAKAGVQVEFLRGNASQMPFEENRFDFAVCRAAFKNFTDPLGALNEMHRVLKPGGTALIIDLRRDATWESINGAVNGMNLGAVNSAITKLTFRLMLLKRAYTRPELQRFLIQTKFAACDIRENPMGFELSLAKAG